MKPNHSNDDTVRQRSSRALQTSIRLNTYAVIGNGLVASAFIEIGFYIAATVSIVALLGHLCELTKLWDRPCDSSR